jgi:fumarylacetoacetase
MNLDETHDPALRSFVASANAPDGDFPIQNLPYAVFRKRGESPRVGVAIGSEILDVAACGAFLDGAAAAAAVACAAPHLNALMERGPAAWAALRTGLSRLLRHDAARRDEVARQLAPLTQVDLMLPVRIGGCFAPTIR